MNVGMLWYQGNPKMTLAEKVTEAALYFKKKYGRTPDTCLLNTKDLEKMPTLESNQVDVDGRTITIYSWKGIVPGHLWLGFEQGPEPVETQESPADAFIRYAKEKAAVGK